MIFQSEFPAIPYSNLPYGSSLLNSLWKHSVETPNKPALINAHDESDQVTYQDLYVKSLSVASFLKDTHFGHGDVAAVCMPNRWEFLPIFCGVALQGGALSGASYQFTEFELERQFKDCGCKIVFCSGDTLDKAEGTARKCPLIRMIIVIESKTNGSYGPGIVSFKTVMATKPDVMFHESDIDVDRDDVFLPYSSGTTGNPKGVMISHKNLSSGVTIYGKHMEEYYFKKIDPSLTWQSQNHLIFAPFYHVFGFVLLQTVMQAGGTAVVMSKFDLELYCKTIEKYTINFIAIVPPILVLLCKSPLVDKYDHSSVKAIFCGGAPSGRELCIDIMKRLPNLKDISQGYGMTEITLSCTLPVHGQQQEIGNVGKVVPNFELKIVDTNTRKPVSANERGEVCVRGPSRMLGYLHRPQATAEVIDDEGWLRTGDIGYVDENGFLFIVDRLKELIKVKGLQVPPAELEDVLLSHPLIKDAAVIGVPHKKDGEQPMAFVVRADECLSEEEVKKYIADRLARYKRLTGGVQFLPQIPKSPSGKILRRFLRDEANVIRKVSKL
ncbi:hypothetical protein QR680_015819 [Steinernema hermaphroditum]|uniref:Uncharacterized protein n=1 Tax=Steinernema hermaphroditum TaxID=289476 RepID=A0AA39LLI9_9BILA|nr:hypothetical protein QR680_015819 [Steinernema hermaphroditum]